MRKQTIDAKKADENALLVLQNVKSLGFENGNRFEGFDTHTTFSILKVNEKSFIKYGYILNGFDFDSTEFGRHARITNRHQTFET